MTKVLDGSDKVFFRNKQDVVAYLAEKILANKNRLVGTEWEMFFVDKNGAPINREGGQKAFRELRNVFRLLGYDAKFLTEKNGVNDDEKIVGLNIPELGSILPEAGYQFEFACSVSEGWEEVMEKNETAYTAINEVAKRLGYDVIFKGHIPGYAENTEGMDRSRSVQWREYYEHRFRDEASLVREAQDGTASVQVTIDSGAENFHEFFKALLLIEPAFSLYYANSQRSHIGVEVYSRLIASQVEPVVNIWTAQNAIQALEAIVEQLMEIDVPFLPDPENPDLYKPEPLSNGQPPMVKDLMQQGRLNEKALINIGGFFYTRPSLRNFSLGLLEVRGTDTQALPEDVADIARRVTALVYNDTKRKALLAAYSHLTPDDIGELHKISVSKDRHAALEKYVRGVKISDFINDIIARSDVIEFKKQSNTDARQL